MPGKLSSSQNALKTGIYAEAEVIPGETAADLESLSADYYTRFNPTTPHERFHIDILIHSDWMLRRFRRTEAHMWERSIERSQSSFNPHEYHLGRAFEHDSRDFGRLQRRIDATQRNYRDALKQLKHLQPETTGAPAVAKIPPQSEIGFVPPTSVEPAAPPVAEPASGPPPRPQIGFVPSTPTMPSTHGPKGLLPTPTSASSNNHVFRIIIENKSSIAGSALVGPK